MQKNNLQSPPSVQNMRLSFKPDGTAIYVPVAITPQPNNSQGVGDNGEAQPPPGFNVNGSADEGVKKKRGRPRKHWPDGAVANAVSPVSSRSGEGAYTPPSSSVNLPGLTLGDGNATRKRGRPVGSGRKMQMTALESAGCESTPHIITMKTGEAGSIFMKAGPVGVRNGDAWDDGIQAGVRKIFVSYTDKEVSSIQLLYGSHNDISKLSPKHGGWGFSFEMIEVSGILTTVCGTWKTNPRPSISSIKFVEKSGQSYGPFGCAEGIPFRLHAPNGVKGFYGSSETLLYCIGIYADTGVEEGGS